jgi:hypothetical protein
MFSLHRFAASLSPGRYLAAKEIVWPIIAIESHCLLGYDPSGIVELLAANARVIIDSALYPGIIAEA